MSVQITNEEETIEITRADFEALKAIAPAIAEQNTRVLEANAATQEAVKAMTAALVDVKGAIVDAVTAAVAGLNITVNVPEQPAPIVNFNVPEAPPAGKKKFKLTPKRDNRGVTTSYDGEVG